MELGLSAARFVRYLTEIFFCIFELLVLHKRSRDHRTHGNVGNSIANRMEVLPGPCGAPLGSEGPPKGHKYAFGTRNHLFWEISRKYENLNSKNFGHESRAGLSWHSCIDLRRIGWLGAAIEPYPGWSVHERLTGAGIAEAGNVFWRLRFLECRYPGCAPRNASARHSSLETSCGCLRHCPGCGGIPLSLQRWRFKSNPKRP